MYKYIFVMAAMKKKTRDTYTHTHGDWIKLQEDIEGKMTTTSKRAGSQHRQQSAPQDDDYDEYVYYQYHPKSRPEGGYEYVQEPHGSERNDQQHPVQYHDERTSNNNAPIPRK